MILECDKEKVMKAGHDNEAGGGHFGRDKMYWKLCQQYYWKGICDPFAVAFIDENKQETVNMLYQNKALDGRDVVEN